MDLSSLMALLDRDNQIQVDWKDTPSAHIIKANIPGLGKEDVNVKVEEDKRILEISAQVSKKRLLEGEFSIASERPEGSFSRRLNLPENAEIEEVKADMENGVLTLIIPKKPAREPRIMSVEISE